MLESKHQKNKNIRIKILKNSNLENGKNLDVFKKRRMNTFN